MNTLKFENWSNSGSEQDFFGGLWCAEDMIKLKLHVRSCSDAYTLHSRALLVTKNNKLFIFSAKNLWLVKKQHLFQLIVLRCIIFGGKY